MQPEDLPPGSSVFRLSFVPERWPPFQKFRWFIGPPFPTVGEPIEALMAISLLATVVFLPKTPKPEHPTSLLAPIKALRHRGLAIMGLGALLYNWAFFTMLRDEGRRAADAFLAAHGGDLGVRGTLDLDSFLDEPA